jgi:hypothetical protein
VPDEQGNAGISAAGVQPVQAIHPLVREGDQEIGITTKWLFFWDELAIM